MQKTLYIPIDTTLNYEFECPLLVKKYDTLKFKFAIFSLGILQDLNGQTVDLILYKKDGTTIQKTITNTTLNIATIILDKNASACIGEVLGEIVITDAGGQVTSNIFKFNVSNSLTEDIEIKSKDDITTIEDMRALIATYKNEISAIGESTQAVEALNNITTYIDTNLSELTSKNAAAVKNVTDLKKENDRADTNIPGLTNLNDTAEEKLQEFREFDTSNIVTTLRDHGSQLNENTQNIEVAKNNICNLDFTKANNVDLQETNRKVDEFANNQIPDEYLQISVDNYVKNNSAGLATSEDIYSIANIIGGKNIFNFTHGVLYMGKVFTDQSHWTIVTEKYTYINSDIRLNAKEGFLISYSYIDSKGTSEDEMGNKVIYANWAKSIKIKSGKYIRLCVKKDDISTGVADINEYISNISMTDNISYINFGHFPFLNANENLNSYPNCKVSVFECVGNIGFPTYQGTVETHKFDDLTYSYQFYNDSLSKDIFYRKFNTDGIPLKFVKIINEDKLNKYAQKIENVGRNPCITFISDDGVVQDYDILKPLSEKYNVPFCTAVITSVIGQVDVNGKEHLSVEQMQELQNTYNWEFLSHTHNHILLGEKNAEEVKNECINSKYALEQYNIKCNGIVYPEGNNSKTTRQVCKDYFDFGVKVEDSEGKVKINTDCIPSFYITRCNLGSFFDKNIDGIPNSNTLDYYKYLVDLCIEKKGWLVFELHTWSPDFDETQQQYLDDLLSYIYARSVKVASASDAFGMFGNLLESGDFLGYWNMDGYAISKNGDITYPKKYQGDINSTTSIYDFPRNTTTTYQIRDTDTSSGFPSWAGTLEVHTQGGGDFGYQIFSYALEDKIKRRRWTDNGGWQAWIDIIK